MHLSPSTVNLRTILIGHALVLFLVGFFQHCFYFTILVAGSWVGIFRCFTG
jgi:hypothetical protein